MIWVQCGGRQRSITLSLSVAASTSRSMWYLCSQCVVAAGKSLEVDDKHGDVLSSYVEAGQPCDVLLGPRSLLVHMFCIPGSQQFVPALVATKPRLISVIGLSGFLPQPTLLQVIPIRSEEGVCHWTGGTLSSPLCRVSGLLILRFLCLLLNIFHHLFPSGGIVSPGCRNLQ